MRQAQDSRREKSYRPLKLGLGEERMPPNTKKLQEGEGIRED